MPKQSEILVELAASLKALTDAVNGIDARVVSLEKPNKPEQPVAQAVSTPVSPEYRQLVDESLNKHFQFRIEPGGNPSFFNFVLLVPKKYSNAPAGYWEMYKEDPRPKVMSLHQVGILLKDHLEKVFNNFNPDTKALIVNDR